MFELEIAEREGRKWLMVIARHWAQWQRTHLKSVASNVANVERDSISAISIAHNIARINLRGGHTVQFRYCTQCCIMRPGLREMQLDKLYIAFLSTLEGVIIKMLKKRVCRWYKCWNFEVNLLEKIRLNVFTSSCTDCTVEWVYLALELLLKNQRQWPVIHSGCCSLW